MSTVVFLHGWGLHGGIWDETAGRLTGFDCRQPDLPGYGDAPTVTPYDAAGLAEAIVASWPDQLHPHPRCRAPLPHRGGGAGGEGAPPRIQDTVLVGWSMGGMAALALAARHPVKALVLIATSPAFVRRTGWDHGLAPEVLAGFADALATDYKATLLRFLSLQARGGDAARETIARLRDSVFARGEPDPATLAAGLELLRSVDLRAEAGRVACPTLVVHGGYDNLCPAGAGEWLAAAIPHARLAMQPRAAHAPFLSHPDWFAGQLQGFLDEIGH